MFVLDDHVEVRRRALVGHRDPSDPGRRQSALRERHLVLRELDDVDLLAPEFANDRLHAGALHADAGAHRIDVPFAAEHSHLRALARGADGGLDDHRAVVDLRHLHLEQLDQETGIGSGHDDLRSLGLLVDLDDHAADALALAVALVARLLAAGNDRLGAAEVDDDVASLEPPDRAVDDLADPVLELVEDLLALRFADALVEHLLGRLGRDPAQALGRNGELDLLAQLGVLLVLASFVQGPLGEGVLDLVDHCSIAEGAELAGLPVHVGAHGFLDVVLLLGRRCDRVLQGNDPLVQVDVLLVRDLP